MAKIKLADLFAIGESLIEPLRPLVGRKSFVFLDVPYSLQLFAVGMGEVWYWIDSEDVLRPMSRRKYRGQFVSCDPCCGLPPLEVGECAVKIWYNGAITVYRIV